MSTICERALEEATRAAKEGRIADGSFVSERPFNQQDAGRYHSVEGHVVQEDGTVQVNLRKGASPGAGASYAVEFESGHLLPVLT